MNQNTIKKSNTKNQYKKKKTGEKTQKELSRPEFIADNIYSNEICSKSIKNQNNMVCAILNSLKSLEKRA